MTSARGGSAIDGVSRALVVGLGRAGTAAACALSDAGIEVVATDDTEHPAGEARATACGVTFDAGDDGRSHLDEVDLVVASPGVAQHAPVLAAAAERGVTIWSEPEVGWRLYPRPVIGVTGTNGKTTVTELVTSMLMASGLEARACGNIGHAFTDAARASGPRETLVAELSSFQLRFVDRLRPNVGVLLNLAPDHLDWHGDLTAYVAAKARIWQAQHSDDHAVGCADDDEVVRVVKANAPGHVAWGSGTGLHAPGVGVERGTLVARLPALERDLVAVDALPVRVPHHISNLAVAACAALLGGASPDGVAAVAVTARPGPHRLERVETSDGITWIDDSKATNPHAAAAALEATGLHGGAIIWIAGGAAKGVDLGTLAGHLGRVRHIVAMGESAAEVTRLADRVGVGHSTAQDVEQAVAVAREFAVAGDTVLLAPACSSLDQYRDYAERGERFARAARGGAAAAPTGKATR